MVGWTDLPADLSDRERIARLDAYLPSDAVLVSSDLQRAVTTADAVAGQRQRLPHEPDLREIHFGDWEMRSYAELEAEDPKRLRAYYEAPGEVRPPGGESWNDVSQRTTRAADRLMATHQGRDIIIVAHFGVILTLLQRAEDVSAEEVLGNRIDNLSVTCLHRGQRWQVERINHCP